jgi:hypothetical protein
MPPTSPTIKISRVITMPFRVGVVGSGGDCGSREKSTAIISDTIRIRFLSMTYSFLEMA